MSWDSDPSPSHWHIQFNLKVLKLEAAQDYDHHHHNLMMLQDFNIPVPVNMIYMEVYITFKVVGLNDMCSDSKSTEREKGGGEREKLREK